MRTRLEPRGQDPPPSSPCLRAEEEDVALTRFTIRAARRFTSDR